MNFQVTTYVYYTYPRHIMNLKREIREYILNVIGWHYYRSKAIIKAASHVAEHFVRRRRYLLVSFLDWNILSSLRT